MTAVNQLTKGTAQAGGFTTPGVVTAAEIAVGGGTSVTQIKLGTTSLNPGSIATITRGTVTFALVGARAGDVIVMNPPAALNDDLVFAGAAVTADDTVTVYLYNPTGGAIDDAAQTWTYLWFSKA